MVIDKTKKPFENCPRFERCSINKCPLSLDYKSLKNNPDDWSILHKQKCISKTRRKRIGIAFNLKNKGMKKSEIKGERRWNLLSDKEKQDTIARLKEFSPFLQLKKKRHSIDRVEQQSKLFTHTKDIKTRNKGKGETR